jgi:tetratricopeptide (TPR) repeat protein
MSFVGREAELDMLKQKLIVNQECRKMSVVGLGGIGKTQIALQFAYMVKENWPNFSIFWVSALSMESFEQACVDIAKMLGIPQAESGEEDAKELVKRHLSAARAGKWLLVVDNADDADLVLGIGQSKGIVDYLPQSEEGVVVYTTRTLEVAGELTRSDVIGLGAMNQQDAIAFLTRSLIKKDLLCDSTATTDLLRELTCLPLAIAQAAAYLNKNGISIRDYLRLLQNTEQDIVDLMSKEFRDDTRKGMANAVATTWMVSFSQICTRDEIAANLLLFMSCIEWKAIPRSILPSVQSEVRMADAIGTLCGYSFLVKRQDNDWYDIHRLVHLATRIWIRQRGDARAVVERGIRHVARIFPSNDHENQAVWRAYLPHAIRLFEDEQSWDVEEKSKLALQIGRCLRVDGRISEAVRWLEESCKQRAKLDKEDSDRLASQHALAMAYEADGQVKKAVELLEQVVAVREKVLAEDHPNRLASQHELAGAYEADGQVKKAVELLEQVVAVQEKVLAEDHPDRLASQHALAIAYQADGQVKKAVELLEQVVAVREKVLAEDHPSRLASQHALAMAYEADGQVKKAVELLEQVVAVEEKVLVEDHPDQLASQYALAVAYQADGQVKKAVELLEQVVAVREKVLAEDHPSRLASQHALAVAYRVDGQVKKAVELLEQVVAVEEKVLAEDHPSRLASQHALARAYQADGQVKKAVELLEQVVAVREKVLAEDHPSRLASQRALAGAYQADRQVKKPVKFLERVVKRYRRVLRINRP